MSTDKTSQPSKQELRFHSMNEAIMEIAKVYMAWHDEEQDFGIDVTLRRAEIHTIQAIGNSTDINITQLALKLQVKKPTVSERINKLVKLGVVTKTTHNTNNKEVLLGLSEKGWTAYNNHEKKHHELYQKFCAHFGDKTSQFMEAFSSNLTELGKFLSYIEK